MTTARVCAQKYSICYLSLGYYWKLKQSLCTHKHTHTPTHTNTNTHLHTNACYTTIIFLMPQCRIRVFSRSVFHFLILSFLDTFIFLFIHLFIPWCLDSFMSWFFHFLILSFFDSVIFWFCHFFYSFLSFFISYFLSVFCFVVVSFSLILHSIFFW